LRDRSDDEPEHVGKLVAVRELLNPGSVRVGSRTSLALCQAQSGSTPFGADSAQYPVPKFERGMVASTCCW
jgi:hypothetical protein